MFIKVQGNFYAIRLIDTVRKLPRPTAKDKEWVITLSINHPYNTLWLTAIEAAPILSVLESLVGVVGASAPIAFAPSKPAVPSVKGATWTADHDPEWDSPPWDTGKDIGHIVTDTGGNKGK